MDSLPMTADPLVRTKARSRPMGLDRLVTLCLTMIHGEKKLQANQTPPHSLHGHTKAATAVPKKEVPPSTVSSRIGIGTFPRPSLSKPIQARSQSGTGTCQV